jgi:surface polysaccharide O-acyltransferase-like enzyme
LLESEKSCQGKRLDIPVDLIRALAIVGVIFLHATNDMTPDSMSQLEVVRWITVDVYQSFARIAVPLFVMLSGALLLQPSKNESLSVFFKKRWERIGIPFFFWGAVYFVWLYFAKNQAITIGSIVQGYLTGPYFQFWYVYMLAGLYLVTPILRLVIAYADDKLIKYFVALWVLGASVIPVVSYFTVYDLNSSIFTITGWVGYYILGFYLLKVRMPRALMVCLMILGVSLAAVGTVYMSFNVGGTESYYFQEYLSPTMILASVMAFLLLISGKKSVEKSAVSTIEGKEMKLQQSKSSKFTKLVHLISENTLPIFLLHLIVLETIQSGFLGFAINGSVINSIIGVPLTTIITLFLCLIIIVPLKKVPILKKLIG